MNFAVAIAQEANGPHHIETSRCTYEALLKEDRCAKRNGIAVDMWRDGTIVYGNRVVATKVTSWHWAV